MIGYHIAASDGEIGHVDDFIVDDEFWTIQHIVPDTSNWPGGRSVLVSPAAVRAIDWLGRRVHVGVAVAGIRNSPEYRGPPASTTLAVWYNCRVM